MKQQFTKLIMLLAFVAFGSSGAFAQLSGSYTIGSGTGYDYASPAAAASALASVGVNGAVTFSITDGTYSGQVSLNSAVSGASATNTITFKGANADSSKVIITNGGSYTVYLNAADYVAFEDVTIQNTSSSTHYTVYLNGNADHNSFTNCRIKGPGGSTFGYNCYVYRSEDNTFLNSRIEGSYYAFRIYGWSTSNWVENTTIENCDIVQNYYYGVYQYYAKNTVFKNNYVDSFTNGSNGYPFMSYYSVGAQIMNNEILAGSYGLYLYYNNYYGSQSSYDTMRIYNNAISGQTTYGFYMSRAQKFNFYHNAIHYSGSNYGFYCYYPRWSKWVNNIFDISGGYYGFYLYTANSSTYNPVEFDYNDLYINNTTSFAYFLSRATTSLSNMQSSYSSYNKNSVSVDPSFPSTRNLRTTAPGLNNIGKDVYVYTDIDGNKRPNTTDKKIDIGANDYYLAPYDLDVYALVNPLTVDLNSNKITAQFRNAGSQTIASTDVYVQYSVDSGTTWITDTMSITSLAPGKVQQFDFSTLWKPTRAGKFRLSLKISTSVSGDPDLLDQEDYDICSGLTGTFTIGASSSANYASFAAAVKDLRCGLAGPLVFNVEPGTYTENVEIQEILGASSSNTLTFRSPSRDSVTLRSTGGNVVTLDGADHVAFENMTIRMDGSSGFTVNITNQGDYNRFENCHIYNNTSVTSTASNPICISGSKSSYSSSGRNGHYNEFIDNDVEGGYMAATIWGNGTSDPSVGNKFINNNFKRAYYYGTYLYYTDSLVFQDNNIDDFRNSYNYALMCYYASNFDIQRNYLKSVYYSSLYYANYYNYNNTARSIFANNVLISSGTSYTLYGYRMSQTNFWHNSLYGKGYYMCYWYYMANNDIRNNIFYYEGSNYCIYTYNPTFVEWDYNDYVIKSGNLAYISGSVISNVSALASWNSNYNQNNFDEDPEWVDKTDDHHVTSKFPEMYGANVGVEVDHDKDDRCAFAPSVGSDEFNQTALPPTANFLAPDTAWLGSPVVLLNSNKASKTTGAKWYVNGKFASDSIHLEYTPTSAGMDTVQLIMENCSGLDSITKMVFVSPILRAPEVDFSATSRDVYTGDIITLLDLSENGATQWLWDISPKVVYDPFLLIWSRTHWYLGGKDSTTANPQLYFDYPGVYEVKLKVANSFGQDSLVRTAYIKVRQRAQMCDIPWDTDGKIGTLYDNGGEFGSYSPGLNGLNKCTYLISDCYGEIDFTIDQFDLGENDYLKIYDGSDDSGRPLWDAGKFPDGMTGNKQDPSVSSLSITAKSGSAYFVFTSDNNSQTIGKGFAIDWEMNQVTWTAPTAAISAPDTVCLGFPTVFTNASTGNFSYVEWDIDGDRVSDGSGEQFSYTFTQSGYDTIWLDAISLCASKDSTMKVVFVENAKKAPKPSFVADETIVQAGDTVTFTGSSDYCTSGTAWLISPANYILANNSTLTDDVLQVVFTRAGYYDVELEKSNSFGKDSIIKSSYIQVLDYCTPSVANLDADVAISRVKFGSIDNSSSVGRAGYNDFLNLSTDVERGYTYELTVERSTTNKELNRKVWIDWNIDGDFDDAGELVAQEAASTNKTFMDSITIDPNAKAGETRMRVAVSYKNLKNLACGPHAFGEFEDYTINILEADKTAPTLVLNGATTDTIEVFGSWVDAGYTSEDLVDGNLTSAVTVNNPLDTATVGVYVITYSVTDNSGNTTTATRTVHVLDRTLPEISLNGDDTVYVQIYTSYNEAGTMQSDNYDAVISPDVNSNVDTAALGTYNINYCVQDANGNGPVCVNRTVIVMDTISPMISLNGNAKEVVEVFTFYTDAGYTVVENDGYTVETTGNWDGTADSLGTFTVTYTVTDYAGNMASVSREIEVVDTKAPLIVLEGNWIDTVARWADYTDAGVTASDNYYDAADLVINVGGTFENTQSAGVYTITYSATDPSNVTSQTLTRLVIVIEDLDGTSIGDVDADGFGIFPNPTNGVFFVKTTLDNGQSAQLRILDLTGKEIYNAGNYVVSNSKFDVNVSDLAAGTYYIEIANNNAKTVKKIVITK
jgi:PKD repeat protein